MKVENINSTNFYAKKFRLPVKTILKRNDGVVADKQIIVREYENSNAEVLWNRALAENDFDKKIKLLSAMGKYRLVDINQKSVISNAKDNLRALQK